MRITFLLVRADDPGGTSHAVFSQAAMLRDRYDIEIVSILRTRNEPFHPSPPDVPVRYLVDMRHEPRAVRDSGRRQDEGLLAATPSCEIDPKADPAFNALVDREVAAELRHTSADVLVTTGPPLLHLATKFAPRASVIVHQEHRTSETRGEANRSLLLSAAHLADVIVVLTQKSAAWLQDALGETAPRLEVLPNAAPSGCRSLSRRDMRTVVAAGRLVRQKQLDHLIAAFARAADDHPGWTLRIFGAGPDAGRLRQLVTRSRLSNQVMLMGLSHHMTREWSTAAIGALTSRHEGFPLVMLEGMASGVPFVSYDCPNAPGEIITNEVDGILVPQDDVDAFAAALSRLMGDDDARNRMGDAAMHRVRAFDPKWLAAEWTRVYDSCDRSRRSRTA